MAKNADINNIQKVSAISAASLYVAYFRFQNTALPRTSLFIAITILLGVAIMPLT